MRNQFNRRDFIKATAIAGAGMNFFKIPFSNFSSNHPVPGKRIGIIGLDTSHSVAYTKALNTENADAVFHGYKIVAAYPYGSKTIESSAKRIPGYVDEVKKYGVGIVDSVNALLGKVDAVLLETNDGKLHLEQALQVMDAGKPLFVDKPVAASMKDVIAIYAYAEKKGIPIFSASSLRYMDSVQSVVNGDIGRVLGADTYSPATFEPSHPDFFWYGIHGIEILMTVMGEGCEEVSRTFTADTDILVGVWGDGRTGTFRGTRTGLHNYGGTVYGEKSNISLGPYDGYDALLVKIIQFFATGKPPVSAH